MTSDLEKWPFLVSPKKEVKAKMTGIKTTIYLDGAGGCRVELITHTYGDSVRVVLAPETGPERHADYQNYHFADILAALVIGPAHVPELPRFCQCAECADRRGAALASKMEEYKVKQNAKVLAVVTAAEAALPYVLDHYIALTRDEGPGDRIAYDKLVKALLEFHAKPTGQEAQG